MFYFVGQLASVDLFKNCPNDTEDNLFIYFITFHEVPEISQKHGLF